MWCPAAAVRGGCVVSQKRDEVVIRGIIVLKNYAKIPSSGRQLAFKFEPTRMT